MSDVHKALEFPVVALSGLGHMHASSEDEKETARVFYVAATRATQKLVVGIGSLCAFGRQLNPSEVVRSNSIASGRSIVFCESGFSTQPVVTPF